MSPQHHDAYLVIYLTSLGRVFHFILLVGRCVTAGENADKAKRRWLKMRIKHESRMLYELRERRQRLLDEAAELEARREVADRPLPALPEDAIEANSRPSEDLIDMAQGIEGQSEEDLITLPLDGERVPVLEHDSAISAPKGDDGTSGESGISGTGTAP